MQGKIIKAVSGQYVVSSFLDNNLYICNAKGKFRYDNIKPLVGDNVEFDIICVNDIKDNQTGQIIKVLKRSNELIRPEVANVDQALVIFAITQPDLNLNLLDRFLVMMEENEIDTVIAFNKIDLSADEKYDELKCLYEGIGYKTICFSTYTKEGCKEIEDILKGKTTVLAGPSGVGKSSTINMIYPKGKLEIGSLSEKIARGKNTTRHTQIYTVDKDTYIMDTPGFSSMYIINIDERNLKYLFKDFNKYAGQCKYNECNHINEPNCVIKEEVTNGNIAKSRYDNYIYMYNDIVKAKRY